MKSLLAVAFFCLLATALPEEVDQDVAKINEYFDDVAKQMKEKKGDSEIDPFSLAEFGIKFNRQVFGVDWEGHALLNGSFTGLSSLKRSGDCSVVKLGDERVAYALFEFDELKAALEGSIEFMKVGKKVYVSISVSGATMGATITLPGEGGPVSVDNVSLEELGSFKTKIDGLGVWVWAANLVIGPALTMVKDGMKGFMGGQCAKLMQTIFENYPYQPGTSYYMVF